MNYSSMSKQALLEQKEKLNAEYESYCKKGLSLDLSRGKPVREQLDMMT